MKRDLSASTRAQKGNRDPRDYRQRDYRRLVHSGLHGERVVVRESDLTIYSETDVAAAAKESLIRHRGYIENYIHRHPRFLDALTPLADDHLAPAVVRQMLTAAHSAGVGPMAAVAGALAEMVGRDLLDDSAQVIVENGGDIFMHTHGTLTIAVFAGPSPLSLKIGIRLQTKGRSLAVCTSSASVGHSLSLGRADAACVVGASCALADAAATALANRVRHPRDIRDAIKWAGRIGGVEGLLVVCGENMGAWGALEVVPI